MSNIGDGLNAYVDNLDEGPGPMTEIEQGYLDWLEIAVEKIEALRDLLAERNDDE